MEPRALVTCGNLGEAVGGFEFEFVYEADLHFQSQLHKSRASQRGRPRGLLQNVRRRATVCIALLAQTTVAACSVLTDVSGLTGSSADGGASSEAGGDASLEGGKIDGATLGESGVETSLPDAGMWAFISSAAKTAAMGPVTVTAAAPVLVGDLVVIGCDSAASSGAISFSGFSATSLPISATPLALGMTYEAVVAWGVATVKINNLAVVATAAFAGQLTDCTVNTYRGGRAATLVEDFYTSGTGAGLVSCPAVSTAKGGLAYYIAARTACAGMPVSPRFVQRQIINGNPNGDFVPADGTTVGTLLADCSASTGDWVCLTVSLSP